MGKDNNAFKIRLPIFTYTHDTYQVIIGNHTVNSWKRMHACILTTVATDVVVLKQTEILPLKGTLWKIKFHFEKKK